jgi:hypothetical protein
MNLIKSTLKAVLLIALFAVCINAESPVDKAVKNLNNAMTSTEGKTQFVTAYVIIDGKTYVANTLHEYNVLRSTAELANVLKRAKANKQIDSTQYAEKTASILAGTKAINN